MISANSSVMSLGITTLTHNAPQHVLNAIGHAAQKTGVDFDYLVNQARTESSFRTDVKASTSSATGLFQFIDQTWLSMVSRHGSKHGLEGMVSQIEQDFQGRYFVSDDTARETILNLRTDAKMSSLMAAELAADNQNYLKAKTGKEASATDLYLSHFLGAGGASKYIKAMQETPYRPAAYLLPAAASSNKNIFYNSDGSPKSFIQIYNDFEQKFAQTTTDHPTKPEVSHVADQSYQRDIQFERMYSHSVPHFIRSFASVDGFQSGSFFDNIFGNDIATTLQNNVNQRSLFLALTMLDSPK